MKYSLLVLGVISLSASGSQVQAFKISSKGMLRQRNDGAGEEANIQIQNIYGIPSDQEKLQIKQQQMVKQKKQKVQNMRKDVVTAFDNFSKNFKESEFDKAMKTKEQVIEMGETQANMDKIKINAVDAFKKGFAFPEVSKNEFSSEVLDELEIAEKNLNSNLENVDLFNNFVETAEECKKKLQNKYGDQWTDPAQAGSPVLAQKEDDE